MRTKKLLVKRGPSCWGLGPVCKGKQVQQFGFVEAHCHGVDESWQNLQLDDFTHRTVQQQPFETGAARDLNNLHTAPGVAVGGPQPVMQATSLKSFGAGFE